MTLEGLNRSEGAIFERVTEGSLELHLTAAILVAVCVFWAHSSYLCV
jgi:hypothetical protein